MKVSCKVTLIEHTPIPQTLVASAAKLCYSNSSIDDIVDDTLSSNSDKYINRLMMMGHHSPFEHVSFTFGIEGVSRSFLAQITRHRIASYSVQSQRYVDCGQGDFNFIVPPSIQGVPELEAEYNNAMKTAIDTYNHIADELEMRYIEENPTANKSALRKKAIEDARFVLPNAAETKMIATFNARSLFNFFSLRCCKRAQWEIRDVAMKMYKLVYNIAPDIFGQVGPSCVSSGKCTEGKMSCGSPNIVIDEFNNIKGA